MMENHLKFIKRLQGMKQVSSLYECEAKCISFFLHLFENRQDFTDAELISLFDPERKCENRCIKDLLREFYPVVYLSIKDFCVRKL